MTAEQARTLVQEQINKGPMLELVKIEDAIMGAIYAHRFYTEAKITFPENKEKLERLGYKLSSTDVRKSLYKVSWSVDENSVDNSTNVG